VLTAFQRLLDKVLGEQQAVRARLLRHAGRRAQIDVLGTSVAVEIAGDGGLRLLGLRTEPGAELHVWIGAETLSTWPSGDLLRGARIEAAADIADDFSTAIRLLRIDPADLLAPLTGDILANRLGQGLTTLLAGAGEEAGRVDEWLRQSVATARIPLPGRSELLQFGDEARALFDALGMLERRIDRLSQGDSGQGRAGEAQAPS
jgi:ubiquinone biosynthesis protein UbiJ